MNRREFAGTVGAGLVFPGEALGSLSPQKPEPRKPKEIRILCIGSDKHPATEDDIIWYSMWLKHNPSFQPYFGLPRTIYAIDDLDFSTFFVGSDNRPASDEDVLQVRKAIYALKSGGVFITRHVLWPYRRPKNDFRQPSVARHTVLKSLVSGKVVAEIADWWYFCVPIRPTFQDAEETPWTLQTCPRKYTAPSKIDTWVNPLD